MFFFFRCLPIDHWCCLDTGPRYQSDHLVIRGTYTTVTICVVGRIIIREDSLATAPYSTNEEAAPLSSTSPQKDVVGMRSTMTTALNSLRDRARQLATRASDRSNSGLDNTEHSIGNRTHTSSDSLGQDDASRKVPRDGTSTMLPDEDSNRRIQKHSRRGSRDSPSLSPRSRRHRLSPTDSTSTFSGQRDMHRAPPLLDDSGAESAQWDTSRHHASNRHGRFWTSSRDINDHEHVRHRLNEDSARGYGDEWHRPYTPPSRPRHDARDGDHHHHPQHEHRDWDRDTGEYDHHNRRRGGFRGASPRDRRERSLSPPFHRDESSEFSHLYSSGDNRPYRNDRGDSQRSSRTHFDSYDNEHAPQYCFTRDTESPPLDRHGHRSRMSGDCFERDGHSHRARDDPHRDPRAHAGADIDVSHPRSHRRHTPDAAGHRRDADAKATHEWDRRSDTTRGNRDVGSSARAKRPQAAMSSVDVRTSASDSAHSRPSRHRTPGGTSEIHDVPSSSPTLKRHRHSTSPAAADKVAHMSADAKSHRATNKGQDKQRQRTSSRTPHTQASLRTQSNGGSGQVHGAPESSAAPASLAGPSRHENATAQATKAHLPTREILAQNDPIRQYTVREVCGGPEVLMQLTVSMCLV